MSPRKEKGPDRAFPAAVATLAEDPLEGVAEPAAYDETVHALNQQRHGSWLLLLKPETI